MFTEPLPGHAEGGRHGDVSDLRYEVMYFLEADDDAIPAFKDVWAGIGDSIVVVGGDGIWNCHIHTDDIGASIEAAIEIGTPRKIRVTDLIEQVEEEKWVREAVEVERGGAGPPAHPGHLRGRGGRDRCRHPSDLPLARGAGDRHRRAVDEPLDGRAHRGGRAGPGRPGRDPAQQQEHHPGRRSRSTPTRTKTVHVVPTKGITEGFAALLAYDPEAESEANAEEMTEAAANVVAGEVTQAVRDSSCEVGPIATGDWIGIARDGIRAVEAELGDAATKLLAELVLPSHEIVTIIEGEGSSVAVTRHLTEWLAEHRPAASAEVHHGGQPLYPYLFGIE